MGRMENDEIFMNALEEERRKIPSFMRMSPAKAKVISIIFFFIGLAELLVVFFWPRWLGAYVTYTKDADGSMIINNVYPVGYIVAMIAVAALTIPVIGYILFSRKFEKDAFRDASRMAKTQKDLQAASERRTDRMIMEQASNLEIERIHSSSEEKDTSDAVASGESLYAPLDEDLGNQILRKSTRKAPDEIDLFEPDSETEIFKKKHE